MRLTLPRIVLSPVLLLLTGLGACSTTGPESAQVHAQRPFLSRDTTTTAPKVVALEAGGAVAAGHQTEVPVLLKYGLGPQSEFFVGTSPYINVDHNETQPDGTGWGDTNLGVRHRLRERDMFSPAYAFQLQTKLPTGRPRHGLGTGETDWFGALMANQVYNGFDTTAFYQLGLLGDPNQPSTSIEHTLALQTRLPAGGNATAFAEAAWIFEPESDRSAPTVMGGVSFLINPLTSLDLAIRLGTDDAQSFQVLFGISRALGMVFFPEDTSRTSSLRR